jgi:hypothetical protein
MNMTGLLSDIEKIINNKKKEAIELIYIYNLNRWKSFGHKAVQIADIFNEVLSNCLSDNDLVEDSPRKNNGSLVSWFQCNMTKPNDESNDDESNDESNDDESNNENT